MQSCNYKANVHLLKIFSTNKAYVAKSKNIVAATEIWLVQLTICSQLYLHPLIVQMRLITAMTAYNT